MINQVSLIWKKNFSNDKNTIKHKSDLVYSHKMSTGNGTDFFSRVKRIVVKYDIIKKYISLKTTNGSFT